MDCSVLKRRQYGNIGFVGCRAPLWVYKQGSVEPIACHMFPKDRSMALHDKYINPFTNFGFKKLFGSEPYLQNRPKALQDRVFQKLFEAAEIAKFTPDEKTNCEESLKYYRDLKNVVDTSFDEGKAEGKEFRNRPSNEI